MTPVSRAALCVAVCLAVLAAAPAVFGDEGMWLFNKPPNDYLKKHITSRRRRPGWSTSRSRRCASTPAAPARSSPPTAW